MSRFKTLLNGLQEAAPQIKGSLKNWAEELKLLQQNPAGNERRIEELSNNIRSTVEANAKREAPAGNVLKEGLQPKTLANSPDIAVNQKLGNIQTKPSQEDIMKKVAGMGAMPAAAAGGMANPLDQLKEGYEKFEGARGKLSDKLADTVTGYLPEASKAPALKQAKSIMNTATDPLSYVGGVGAVDAALGATAALPEIDEETKERFKGLWGK